MYYITNLKVYFPPYLYTKLFSIEAYVHDNIFLLDADFVASYEIGDFTYYFFREAAVEYINCGKVCTN